MNKILWTLKMTFLVIFIYAATISTIALTIGYSYHNEIIHYHTNTCNINNCTKTITDCCYNNPKNEQLCRSCYRIDVNYNLFVLNQSYSKISALTVDYPDFCNQIKKNLTNCYYDDRNILASLRLLNDYVVQPNGSIIGTALVNIDIVSDEKPIITFISRLSVHNNNT